MPNKAQITESVNGQIINTPISGEVLLIDATGEGAVKKVPVNGQMSISDFFRLAGVAASNVAASVNGRPVGNTATVSPGDRVGATPSNVKGAWEDGPSDDVTEEMARRSGAVIAD